MLFYEWIIEQTYWDELKLTTFPIVRFFFFHSCGNIVVISSFFNAIQKPIIKQISCPRQRPLVPQIKCELYWEALPIPVIQRNRQNANFMIQNRVTHHTIFLLLWHKQCNNKWQLQTKVFRGSVIRLVMVVSIPSAMMTIQSLLGSHHQFHKITLQHH